RRPGRSRDWGRKVTGLDPDPLSELAAPDPDRGAAQYYVTQVRDQPGSEAAGVGATRGCRPHYGRVEGQQEPHRDPSHCLRLTYPTVYVWLTRSPSSSYLFSLLSLKYYLWVGR